MGREDGLEEIDGVQDFVLTTKTDTQRNTPERALALQNHRKRAAGEDCDVRTYAGLKKHTHKQRAPLPSASTTGLAVAS